MNEERALRAAGGAAVILIALSLLKRSRLARLAVVGAGAAYVATRLLGRQGAWHEVPAPGSPAE